MFWQLPQTPTADRYGDAATLRCPGASTISIYVFHEPVTVQFAFQPDDGPSPAGEEWAPGEINLSPGDYSFDRDLGSVRARSRWPGRPALVAMEAT